MEDRGGGLRNTLDLRLCRTIENKTYGTRKCPGLGPRSLVHGGRIGGGHGQWKKAKRIFARLAISMSSSRVHVRELDVLTQPKMVGWSLPVVVAEALAKGLSKT